MSSIRKPLKFFSVVMGSLVALILVFALCVMEWPSILVNSHTLSMAARFSNRKSEARKVSWNQARVEVHHRGLFSNQLVFHFQDLCFEDSAYGHGCFEELSASFAYGFKRALPRLLEVGPARARANEIALQVPEQTAATRSVTVSPKSKTKKSALPMSLIADAKINPIDVQVAHWTFTLPNLQLAGSYTLQGAPAASPATGVFLTSKIDLSSESHAMKGALNTKAQITAKAENDSDRLGGSWKGQIDLNAHSPNLKAELSTLALISPGQEGHVDFRVKNKYLSPLGKASLELAGWTLPGIEARGEVHGQFEPTQAQRAAPMSLLSLLQMNRFQLKGCRFDLLHPDHDQQDGKLTAGCFVDSQIVHFRLYEKQQPPIKLWRELGVLLKSEVTLPAPAHSTAPFKGQITLEPRSDERSPLQLGGQVTSHFEVMPAEVPVPRELQTAIDLKLAVPQFKKLVEVLLDTPIAVPAPLRTLEGPASMSMRGNLTLNKEGHLAVDLDTHLNHPPDRLNMTGNGKIAIEALRTVFDRPPRLPQMDARMEIALSDIHLTLPQTGISTPPSQVLPDPRIHTNVPNVTSEVTTKTQHGELDGVHYWVHVATPNNHPIEIASQFLKKPITIGLDLSLRQGQPWMGFAEINGNKEPVGVPSSQMAGQAAEERTGPKLPFGFSELVSSLLTGVPFEWVSTQPQTGPGVTPKKEETRIHSVIELRRRY